MEYVFIWELENKSIKTELEKPLLLKSFVSSGCSIIISFFGELSSDSSDFSNYIINNLILYLY